MSVPGGREVEAGLEGGWTRLLKIFLPLWDFLSLFSEISAVSFNCKTSEAWIQKQGGPTGAQKEIEPHPKVRDERAKKQKDLKSATHWDHFPQGHSLTSFNTLKMVTLLQPRTILRLHHDYLAGKKKVKSKIQ